MTLDGLLLTLGRTPGGPVLLPRAGEQRELRHHRVLARRYAARMAKMSPSRQRNAVSEGAALGLVMCGRLFIPTDRFAVGLSFEDAWLSWPYRSQFSQVSTDLRQGTNGEVVLTRADANKHVFNLYWEPTEDGFAIRPRARWEDGIDADQAAQGIDGDVPAEGWRQLAATFLRHFDKED